MSSVIFPLTLQGTYFNQYHIIAKVNNYILPILIDTGSSISCIQSKFCTSFQPLINPLYVSRCFDSDCELSTSTIVEISFDNKKDYKLALLVHDPETMEIPLILGVDFLDAIQSYTITYDHLYLTIDGCIHMLDRMLLSQQELNKQLGL